MIKNDGKYLEEIVELLEKSISPQSVVDRNVFLPSLTTGGRRQCDVVIRTGKKPRQKITIVEVQDRGTKVTRNEFGGWIEKT